MACQVSNGQFCHINSFYIQQILNILAVMPLSLKKDKINTFYILLLINQTQDEAFNINDNFCAISTLQDNKKLYITCLQCCVMQTLHIGNYLVFSVSTATVAYTKEQCLTPTYFPYFLTSLL